ncbi:MAG: hypothetical protein ABIN48_12340 [Ginsengibacter sp.]
MRQFEIEIKNEKKKNYRFINWFALLGSLAGFGILLFSADWLIESLGAIVILLIYILTRIYRRRKHNMIPFFDEKGYFFFVLCIGWLGLQNYLVAAICLVLGVVYQTAMQKISFLFNKELVTKTNFPKREIEWQDIENVVLKDNILTIDFKNNHIIQGEINSTGINEKEFNLFVQSEIRKNEGIERQSD